MKVWNAIVTIFLVAIIVILGIRYFNLSNAYNKLSEKSNALIKENDILMEKQNIIVNEENNNSIESVEKDNFYEVVKNNANKYLFWDSNATKKENVKNFIDAFCWSGTDIPVFSDSKQLTEENLYNIFMNVTAKKEFSNIYIEYNGVLFDDDAIENILTDCFGDDFDISGLNLEKLSIYPVDGYEDIYTFVSSREFIDLYNPGYVIADFQESEDYIDVTVIEYSLTDEDLIFQIGEKTKRKLYNVNGDIIKVYDVEGVQGEYYIESEAIENGKIVTEEDIEKYILDNKDKFEKKKIKFEKTGSSFFVKSCESVK